MRATLPDLSARQLEAVLALVEYGSFVAAAARLRISQPALTRAVKRLEAALGVRCSSAARAGCRLPRRGASSPPSQSAC